MAHMLPVELLPNYLVNERFIASWSFWHLRSAGVNGHCICHLNIMAAVEIPECVTVLFVCIFLDF